MEETPQKPVRRITLDCPECGKELRTAERNAGKTVPCPDCRSAIVIPPPLRRVKRKKKKRQFEDEAEPESAATSSGFTPWYESTNKDSYTGLGGSKRRTMKNLPPGWEFVRNGLAIVSVSTIAVCFILLGMAAATYALIWLLTMAEYGGTAGIIVGIFMLKAAIILGVRLVLVDIITVPILLGTVGYLIVLVLLTALLPPVAALLLLGVMALAGLGLLAGWCCCFTVPNEGALRWFIYGSAAALLLGVVCHSITVVLVMTVGADLAALRGGELFALLSLGAFVFGLLGHALFVLFLRSIGTYFRDEPTAEYITSFLTYEVIAVLVSVGLQAALVFGGGGPIASCMLFFVIMVLGLIGGIWFLRCVEAARNLVRPYMRE